MFASRPARSIQPRRNAISSRQAIFRPWRFSMTWTNWAASSSESCVPVVEPRGAAAEDFDVEFAGVEVEAVEVGDFEFAALGGFQLARHRDDVAVVEINSGNRVVRFRLGGLFFERKHATVGGELDDAVAFRIGDV